MFAGLEIADAEIIGMVFAFFLTVLVLLYAFGDNALFRLVIHVFIGVAAGYAGAIAMRDVLIPQIKTLYVDPIQLVIPLLWMGMLITKISPRTAVLGNPASALLVGVGAAIAVGGAIQGTLLPQISGAANFFSPDQIGQGNFGLVIELFFDGTVILVGTIATLISFHFGAKGASNQIPRRNRIISLIAKVGQGFIAITFGVIFAGVYSAALTALVERLDFIVEFLVTLLSIVGMQ